jgi:hypothetical protein
MVHDDKVGTDEGGDASTSDDNKTGHDAHLQECPLTPTFSQQ